MNKLLLDQILVKMALMDLVEKNELARISSLLPENAVIVEIGSFMGGSAVIMANAAPTSQIHCFDLFEDDPWKSYRGPSAYKLFDILLNKENSERSIENVGKILRFHTNINLNKCRSPDNIIFDKPIDLYFEDGLHSNPALEKNLNFWAPKVKSGGYIVMHDCRPWLDLNHYHRFVDVENALNNFLNNGYSLISHVGALVTIQKNF